MRFRMTSRDVNAIPTQYRCWVVPNTPDLDGYYYSDLKSGTAPMVDITPYAIDNTVVANFNLPQPSMWNADPTGGGTDFPILKILPSQLDDAHLAIISDGYSGFDGYGHPDGYNDGYVYMFGGKLTNKIFRAALNRPADWNDTGATLPGNLYGASLAIANGYVWLFGGLDDNGPTDTVFSAPISDPLTWTNQGHLLPSKLGYSSLGMYGGFLYLFGGLSSSGASDVILRASTSNPLAWTYTGFTLPTAVYGSYFAQINNNWMKFGGMTDPNTPVKSIWQASVSSPTSWSYVSNLPYATAFGQFVSVGDDGYLLGPMIGATTSAGSTGIMQCHLNAPQSFFDTNQTIHGSISHMQLAVIYDRVWLFGGSGARSIFACNQELKYSPYDPVPLAYGQITRTLLFNTDNVNYPFQTLGMPYWITSYLL